MLSDILIFGAIAGVVHFALLGALYGNPAVDRSYRDAMATQPSVRNWPSKSRYLLLQFVGTQLEIYVLASVFFICRGAIPFTGVWGDVALGALLTTLRVYPRFWNMWIQSTYPRHLLAIELVNGTIGTMVVTVLLGQL